MKAPDTYITSKPQPVAIYPAYIVHNVPNEKEFGKLFRTLYQRLCFFAFTIMNDRTSAEDIVQDCFAQLWQKREKINWKNDITPYLYGMVRFSAFHFVRDKKVSEELQEEMTADEQTALLQMIETETLQEIFSAIDTLPSKCGDIFRSLFISGKTIGEISADQLITESTVRSHKAAALAILRHKIANG